MVACKIHREYNNNQEKISFCLEKKRAQQRAKKQGPNSTSNTPPSDTADLYSHEQIINLAKRNQ